MKRTDKHFYWTCDNLLDDANCPEWVDNAWYLFSSTFSEYPTEPNRIYREPNSISETGGEIYFLTTKNGRALIRDNSRLVYDETDGTISIECNDGIEVDRIEPDGNDNNRPGMRVTLKRSDGHRVSINIPDDMWNAGVYGLNLVYGSGDHCE